MLECTVETMSANWEQLVTIHGVTQAERAFVQDRPCECFVSLLLQVCGFMHGYFMLYFFTERMYLGHSFCVFFL